MYRSQWCTQCRLNLLSSHAGLSNHATGPPNNQLPRRLLQRSPPGRSNRASKTQTKKVYCYTITSQRRRLTSNLRNLTPQTLPTTLNRGNILWESIYHPFSSKLTSKLAQSHPDLPVFIIEAEYGALFSDPPNPNPNVPNIGRVLMSLLAVSVLRAQTGVGPQVVSHMFGLRKAFEDGTAAAEESVEGGEWLAGDEGGMWVLGVVDGIVGAIGEGRGTSFAPGGEKAKL